MRIVFLGTPEFAVPTLEHIIAAGHEVPLVVTQPDRPKGRKQEVVPSPVKAAALAHGLEVYQPERVRRPEAVERLRAVGADVMVVVGYGQIIPQNVIDLAPRGIINVHASLLPELRGAAPIQWAVARGFERTGVTTMQIDAGLDTGAILMRAETTIGSDETAPELSRRLSGMGAELLVQTLAGLESGAVTAVAQDHARATHAPILAKEDGHINWSCPAKSIHNLVRGLQPWPGAWTSFRGQSLHIWRSRLTERVTPAGSVPASEPNTVFTPGAIIHEEGVFAIGGDGAALELLEVQLEGRKRMAGNIFANGHRLNCNDQLGA